MERKLIYKITVILSIIGICAYFAFPLNKRINLGLDLKGGMHLLFKVDTEGFSEDAKLDAVEREKKSVGDAIARLGVREPVIQRQGLDELVVQLPGVTDRQ